ncbi:ciliary microtubule associated protein 1A-like isoform X2 [Lineus longissimus]|uniref:ciliary microtubule associated protein 1A-like isoform X2 n=1 Tax=Lineus longissimus TaxID=88925 RepID=UPI00315C80B2
MAVAQESWPKGRCLGWPSTTPRGPCAAIGSNPGPGAYGLPTLVGQPKHDPRSTKNRNPAFPFGTRHGKLVDECGPGPAHYPDAKITRYGADGTPHYTLKDRTALARPANNPGPGSYSPEKAGQQAHFHAPQFSFGARNKNRGQDKTPAANSYTMPSMMSRTVQSNKKTAPCYSVRGRSKIGGFHEDLQKTPGPGTYTTTTPHIYKAKSPAYTLSGHCAMPGDGTQKPGPGAHSPEKVIINKRAAPGWHMGLRHSQYICPLIENVVD